MTVVPTWKQLHKERCAIYDKNYRKLHRDSILAHSKEYYAQHRDLYHNRYIVNRENIILSVKKYQKENPEKIIAYKLSHRDKYRFLHNRYGIERRKIDPKFHIDSNMATAIYMCLRGKKAFKKWSALVGYTIEGLMKHLEKQFTPQMSWDNYGSYWDIDHIKPKSLFHYTCPEDQEFKDCWALSNLQPLEHIENIKKSNHYKE